MYTLKHELDSTKSAECPECGSNRLIVGSGKLLCSNCGFLIGNTFNKYGAKRTTAKDGITRDSKYEASVADDLYTRKLAKDIKDYDTQFKAEIPLYNKDGIVMMVVKHKIDFRIHHNDGSYELLEAKGVETADYKWRRRLLELFWLPEHPDHIYTVVKQNVRKR